MNRSESERNLTENRQTSHRILLVNYECPPLGGGGGVAAWKLAKGWVALGWDVDYLTSKYPGLSAREVVEGITVYRVPAWGRKDRATATMLSMLCYVISAILKGIQLCIRRHYRFINTHFAIPSGPVGAILSTVFRLPNILSVHGGDIYDPSKTMSPHRHAALRSVVNAMLRQASNVVSQSSNTHDNVRKYYNASVPIEIIPLAYESIDFPEKERSGLGMEEGIFYLISTGRLVERKGYRYLIEALSRLPEKVSLIIIGDGPLLASLQEKATTIGVADHIIWTGYVTEERKFQYLRAADLYVLSSLHEGFGIVIQEAMQVSLPIVATNYGGQVDLIDDGYTGLLVPPADVSALACVIRRLYDDPVLREILAQRAHKKLTAFMPSLIATRYLELIGE